MNECVVKDVAKSHKDTLKVLLHKVLRKAVIIFVVLVIINATLCQP